MIAGPGYEVIAAEAAIMYIRSKGKEATRIGRLERRGGRDLPSGPLAPARKETHMKFVVEPQKEERQEKAPGQHTRCALCSEDPRFCITE